MCLKVLSSVDAGIVGLEEKATMKQIPPMNCQYERRVVGHCSKRDMPELAGGVQKVPKGDAKQYC